MSLLAAKAGFETAKAFLGAVPRVVWYALAVAAVLLLARHQVIRYGDSRYAAGRADLLAEQAKAAKSIVAKQAAITTKVVTKYIDRVRILRERGTTIVKEVPVYVPSDACPLPGGFRVLHDAAAQGAAADPARVADAAPVPAQDAAATVADNYTTCHETAERLSALQDWVRRQEAAAK